MRTVAALLYALLLAGCVSGTSTQTAGGFVSGSGADQDAPSERTPAPDIVGDTLDGEQLALADLTGPVVVNFWASWCGPCAREAPDLRAIAETYQPVGVHVVGVNVSDREANARSFERDFGIPYPSWSDQGAQIASAFGGVGPSALPTTILLDAEHRVAARLFGEVTAAQLSVRLDELLREAGMDPP